MLVYLCHFADMDDTVFVSSLNAIQKARMASIAKLSRARQYLYSRVVYNALFSQYTGKPFMEDLPKAQPHPSIEGKNGARFFTSLSHSGNHVALALSDKGKVAIDMLPLLFQRKTVIDSLKPVTIGSIFIAYGVLKNAFISFKQNTLFAIKKSSAPAKGPISCSQF